MFPLFCRTRSVVVLSTLSVLAGIPAARASYTFTSLDKPGANITAAFGIDGGIVVGNYTVTNAKGFSLTGGVYTTLPSNETYPSGIDGTTIVGSYSTGGHYHGFTDNAGIFTDLYYPSTTGDTKAFAISGSTVVGEYVSGNVSHGFVEDGGVYTTLDDPLAGTGTGEGTAPHGISNGVIVGIYVKSGVAHGFTLSGGTYTTIDVPGASNTYLYAIDNDTLAGYYSVGAVLHGFVYSGGVFTTVDNPLATDPLHGLDNHITGISGTTLVGWYGSHAYMATLDTVPEPSSLALSSLGAACLLRRRKRK